MFTIGLDLGQRQDFSAIAVVERIDEYIGYQAPVFESLALRRVERVPLRTPYPKVVERIRAMVMHPSLQGRCRLVVDATGVGAPVVDLLRAAGLGCQISAVTITGGEQARQSSGSSSGGIARWSVPKRDLISGIEVLLERKQLRMVRDLRDGGALLRELMDMQASTRANGRVRLGADGSGQHDDLVIAVALACWQAQQVRSGYGAFRLQGI